MKTKTFNGWASNKEGIFRTKDPTYFIESDRFNNRENKNLIISDNLGGWINHLRSKTYFNDQDELDFIRAYLYHKEQINNG